MTEISNKMITIEVTFALIDQQSLLKIELMEGLTVQQAIEQSGILRQYPQIDLSQNKVGVFSKVCKLDRILENGDRIEIYHPLHLDPKQRRREKAAKAALEKKKNQ